MEDLEGWEYDRISDMLGKLDRQKKFETEKLKSK